MPNIRRELMKLIVDMDTALHQIDQGIHDEVSFPTDDEGLVCILLVEGLNMLGSEWRFESHEKMIAHFREQLK